MLRARLGWLWFSGVLLVGGCDKDSKPDAPAVAEAPAPVPGAASGSAPLLAPQFIVDPAYVTVGKERASVTGPGLTERVATLLDPWVAGYTDKNPDRPLDVVIMRSVKPSQVAAVLSALRKVVGAGASISTEARSGSTDKLRVSFATSVVDCTTAAWIGHDASIEIWPAGGGAAKRVIHGLAGPDMTLGLEAIRSRPICNSPQIVIGADESMTWGLVFDLATTVVEAPGARASAAILVTSLAPGHKVELR